MDLIFIVMLITFFVFTGVGFLTLKNSKFQKLMGIDYKKPKNREGYILFNGVCYIVTGFICLILATVRIFIKGDATILVVIFALTMMLTSVIQGLGSKKYLS